MKLNPVTFPPGLARLVTSPDFTGISHSHQDDGDGLGGLFGGLRRRRIDGDDHLDPEVSVAHLQVLQAAHFVLPHPAVLC